jgi:HAD superfamily hydrolase (TIGR01509 family)
VTELVIFDCDGVLVDSDRISLRVQAEMLCELGVPTSYDACVRDFLGIGMPAMLAAITARLGRPLPRSWIDELDQAVRNAFTDELTPTPGIVEALNQITVPTCIASSGSHDKMRFTLGLTDLYRCFEGRIFSGDEVAYGKPAPDLFLHAAHSMTTAAAGCVVVEDSPSGVQASESRRYACPRLRRYDTQGLASRCGRGLRRPGRPARPHRFQLRTRPARGSARVTGGS